MLQKVILISASRSNYSDVVAVVMVMVVGWFWFTLVCFACFCFDCLLDLICCDLIARNALCRVMHLCSYFVFLLLNWNYCVYFDRFLICFFFFLEFIKVNICYVVRCLCWYICIISCIIGCGGGHCPYHIIYFCNVIFILCVCGVCLFIVFSQKYILCNHNWPYIIALQSKWGVNKVYYKVKTLQTKKDPSKRKQK